MLNFNGKTDDADEVHRIAQLLLPLNLSRSRIRYGHLNAAAAIVVVLVSTVIHRAFDIETAPCEG